MDMASFVFGLFTCMVLDVLFALVEWLLYRARYYQKAKKEYDARITALEISMECLRGENHGV